MIGSFASRPGARGAARVVALALLLLAARGRGAGASPVSTAFADIDPGPRLMAMGGAGVAGVQDPSAAWWNPAGLYFLRGTQGLATYDDLYGQGLVRRNYLAAAWKRTQEEPVFRDNRLYLTADDARGMAWGVSLSSISVDLGAEDYSELMPALAVAGGLGPDVAFGLSLAYLRAGSSLDGVSAQGYTVGLGTMARLPGGGRVGLSARNLLSRVFWEGNAIERLGLTATAGASWPVTPVADVRGDLSFGDGQGGLARLSLGGEYRFLDGHVAARAGLRRYINDPASRNVPTFGGGLHWSRFDLDYALTADGDGPGSTHRFGLMVLLAKPPG